MLLCKFRQKKNYIYVDPHENLYIIAIGYTLTTRAILRCALGKCVC